ncbi:MAG: ATP-binding protein [Pleurocapsa sp.]
MSIDLCRIIVVEKIQQFCYSLESYIQEINRQTSVNYQLIWNDNFNLKIIKEPRATGGQNIYIIDLDYLVNNFKLTLPILPDDLAKAIAYLKTSVLVSSSNPIIILTENYETGIKTLQAGATDYLSKTELTKSSVERSLRLSLINTRKYSALQKQSLLRLRQLKQQNRQQIDQIERQKQAEIELQCQELARSNAELEQFAYIASHDLQAPLHTITNYAQLLELRYQEKLDEKGNKYLDYIVNSASKMKTQIEDLLEYSRLGRQKSTWRETDLYLVVQQAIANLQLEIETKKVIIDCLTNFPTLVVDSSQLVVLWQNLIENSIKYCRQEPLIIQLRVNSIENYWQFSVSDNGIGFEPQYKQRIFQIFQRLHTQDEYPGNGIGLAICQKIVEQHGGNIWVESQVGRGSTFYFTIPQ